MADLVKDVKYLRYYHTSDDFVKDKDILKNRTFERFSNKVSTLFLLPVGFQVWQLLLVNNIEKAALYRKVRIFKALTLIGAVALSFREKLAIEYQWQYYDRFYPEATELQKGLLRDAMVFKESQFEVPSIEERSKLDLDTKKIYEQMYRLPPQTIPDADENPNAPTIKNHW